MFGDNDMLPVKVLRMKVIVLFALATMLWPSEIAPKVQVMVPSSGDTRVVVFSTTHFEVNSDGVTTITFFGMKTDAKCASFVVSLPPHPGAFLDLVGVVSMYIRRIAAVWPSDFQPVFLPLRPPYRAICVMTVGAIMEDSIREAGLDPTSSWPSPSSLLAVPLPSVPVSSPALL